MGVFSVSAPEYTDLMKSKPIHLETHYLIKAPREKIYAIMTDFENLPRYFPSVAKEAKVLMRDGNRFVVEAKTKAFFGSKTFTVLMEGELQPPRGLISTNTSSLGVEKESFMMEEIPEGTRIDYVNDVEITSWFFRIFGNILIKHLALWYWERAVFRKLKTMMEENMNTK